MGTTGESICSAFDVAWARFTDRLRGLQTDEYFWEPVAGCWSVRKDPAGSWRIDGSGGNTPAPEPPPITTIAWRIGHVAGMALGGFADRLFGNWTLTVEGIAFPATAPEAQEFCDRNYRFWRDGIGGVGEERWWQPLGPRWSPYEDSNTVDLALHVLDEVVHHGGEIGLLRDLYLRRDELGG